MKYIVSFSGGKDSTATLLWALDHCSPGGIIVVFCDTHWETPLTYEYVEYIKDFCIVKGVTFKILDTIGFERLVLKKNFFPKFGRRFCTQELKVKPFIDYLKTFQEGFCCLTGERREESNARRNLPYTDIVTKNGLEYNVIRPIVDWKESDVFSYIKNKGLRINPMYELGFTRVGCAPCIMRRQKELYLYNKYFPEQIDKIRNLENELHKKGNKGTFFYRKRPITIDEMVAKVIEKFN